MLQTDLIKHKSHKNPIRKLPRMTEESAFMHKAASPNSTRNTTPPHRPQWVWPDSEVHVREPRWHCWLDVLGSLRRSWTWVLHMRDHKKTKQKRPSPLWPIRTESQTELNHKPRELPADWEGTGCWVKACHTELACECKTRNVKPAPAHWGGCRISGYHKGDNSFSQLLEFRWCRLKKWHFIHSFTNMREYCMYTALGSR